MAAVNSAKKRALREVRELYAGNLFLAFRDLAEQFGDDPETTLRCTRELVRRVYTDSYTAVIDVADARGDITVAAVELDDFEDVLERRLNDDERKALAYAIDGSSFDEWLSLASDPRSEHYMPSVIEKADLRESTDAEREAWANR